MPRPVIFILAGSRGPCSNRAQEEIGHGHAGQVGVEHYRTALEEKVANVRLLMVNREAKRKAMLALDPAHAVCVLVGVPDEGAAQIITRGEKSGYVELLDHGAVLVLLLVNRHPQRLEVRYSRGRTAFGELSDIAEVNIVDQGRGERVDLTG